MAVDKVELGKRIEAARKERGLSQKELASRLGLQQSYYSQIENGKYGISVEKLVAIVRELDIPYEFLLDEKSDTKPEQTQMLHEIHALLHRMDAHELHMVREILKTYFENKI